MSWINDRFKDLFRSFAYLQGGGNGKLVHGYMGVMLNLTIKNKKVTVTYHLS